MVKVQTMIVYPSWHFIGSKLSMISWLETYLKELDFSTALDLFGGSGIVSHYFRLHHKKVIYNDFLKFLQSAAFGILNVDKGDKISSELVYSLLNTKKTIIEPNSALKGYLTNYFFEDEVKWILNVSNNILNFTENRIQQGLCVYALSQTLLKKRPFHTFHGSFLNLRLKEHDTPQTWDKDMNETFRAYVHEINSFSEQLPLNLPHVTITGFNASECKPEMFTKEKIDLVYIDPPFISNKKRRTLKFANYTKNYHVLDLLLQQNELNSFINSKTEKSNQEDYLPIQEMNLWLDQNQKNWLKSFERIIKNFEDSTIVVSYRSDSLITHETINQILESYKQVAFFKTAHKYEKENKKSKFEDYLFIGT